MQGAQVPSLARELDPAYHSKDPVYRNEDPAQPNK